MANRHRMIGPKDCEYYLQRLDALPPKFDQVMERSNDTVLKDGAMRLEIVEQQANAWIVKRKA
jgi:uncharacterized protein (DUF885 family)